MGKLLSGAVVVPRVEGFRAAYASDEQHRKAADNPQRPLARP
jgi:hypothetical protein